VQVIKDEKEGRRSQFGTGVVNAADGNMLHYLDNRPAHLLRIIGARFGGVWHESG